MIDSETLHNIAAGRVRPAGLVSIVIPHYETPELARLCLRAIRRFTTVPYEVLVVDNGSGDGASLEYLRGVSWIRLVERPAAEVPAEGALAHATALDAGLAEARGELLPALHTDTIARGEAWLSALREPMQADDRVAVVGCDKIDAPSPAWRLLKAAVDGKSYRRMARRALGRPVPEELRSRAPHARSFCALYRREVLCREGLGFVPNRMRTAGEEVYHGLLERGYRGVLVPPRRMRELVMHVVHATAYLSERRTIRTGRVRRRTRRRIRRLLREPWIRHLLEDDSLDQP